MGTDSFSGLGGKSVCGSFGRGGFGLGLGMLTVVFISAIFSPIGAILRELQLFLCLGT